MADPSIEVISQKCISWRPVELAVLDEKHTEYLSHKPCSEERAAILKAAVAALQNVSSRFTRAALTVAHEKLQVFFKNTRARTCSSRKCSGDDSALWAKDDEGPKIWEVALAKKVAEGKVNESNCATIISSVKSKCFKALSDEEKHIWEEKAEELRMEWENLSIDDLIADNKEGLFVKVASALQGLIGSKGWQAGEDVGFHFVDIMPAGETESFSTFEGRNEAEDTCWERFMAQAFLVNCDTPRACDDVGKPVLPQMEEDWTVMHIGKTLKEYMEELWFYTCTNVEDLPELPWDALGDVACELVATDWRGSVDTDRSFHFMVDLATIRRCTILDNGDILEGPSVNEMAIAPDGDAVIADGDAVTPNGDAVTRDGDATNKQKEEEEDNDDDVVAQTPSWKWVVTHVNDDGEPLDPDNILMHAFKHSAAETAVAHSEHTVNKGKGVAAAGDAVSMEVRREGDKVVAGHEDAVDEQCTDGVHECNDESNVDVEGEDNDEKDGRSIGEVVKVTRGRKWKQGPRASTSTSNTKAAGQAVNKKCHVAVSVVEKRCICATAQSWKSLRTRK
ncbi:hypothetical protein BKA93DRAFT_831253 [Sparassis latifolia]